MKRQKLILTALLLVILMFLLWGINKNSGTVERKSLFNYKRKSSPNSTNCAKKTSVFFLKTHKCGSSTVQNIFMRFGLENGLNFVLPDKANYVGNPEPFSPDLIGYNVALPQGEKYDIFTHHTRYDHSKIKRVMKENAPFVTIMRDPLKIQVSLFKYYRLDRLYNSTLSEFLQLGHEILMKMPRAWYKIGWNQMAWDLGVYVKKRNYSTDVNELMNKVEAEFDLVMIMEYMEASLVLLSDLMCWTLEDVRFLTLNKGFHGNNGSSTDEHLLNLTEFEINTLQTLNFVDLNLYNHFKDRLKDRIQKYGLKRMISQVKRLMFLNSRLYDDCVTRTTNATVDGFTIYLYELKANASSLCENVVLDELSFTEKLRSEQAKRNAVIKKLKDFVKSNH